MRLSIDGVKLCIAVFCINFNIFLRWTPFFAKLVFIMIFQYDDIAIYRIWSIMYSGILHNFNILFTLHPIFS